MFSLYALHALTNALAPFFVPPECAWHPAPIVVIKSTSYQLAILSVILKIALNLAKLRLILEFAD